MSTKNNPANPHSSKADSVRSELEAFRDETTLHGIGKVAHPKYSKLRRWVILLLEDKNHVPSYICRMVIHFKVLVYVKENPFQCEIPKMQKMYRWVRQILQSSPLTITVISIFKILLMHILSNTFHTT